MVLKGSRDIDETFFIEPTTGVAHPTDWEEYLGIESLWNHKNYYINMQQYEIKGISVSFFPMHVKDLVYERYRFCSCMHMCFPIYDISTNEI